MSKTFASFIGGLTRWLVLCAALAFAAPASAKDEVFFLGAPPPAPAQTTTQMRPGDIYRMVRTSIARVLATWQVEGKLHGVDGTGFIVDAHGDLATNCHVAAPHAATGPVNIEIQFPDDPTWLHAKVMGCDRDGDIAVIHVDGLSPNRRPLHFAKPGTFGPGDEVIAVGYALGFDGDPTVSRGIVSALRRSVDGGNFSDLVQTDAVINGGNSGGPLLDMYGDVVGVNTYSAASSLSLADIEQAQKQNAVKAGSAPRVGLDVVEGIFYARSAATAEVFVKKIISVGVVDRPDFGITVTALNPTLHLPRRGVQITSIAPGSAAERAGLTDGSIIYSIELGNGVSWEIHTPGDLNDALALMTSGRAVKVQSFALTKNGADQANKHRSVPSSEVKWFSVEITPITATGLLLSTN
jgi:serine protease Do